MNKNIISGKIYTKLTYSKNEDGSKAVHFIVSVGNGKHITFEDGTKEPYLDYIDVFGYIPPESDDQLKPIDPSAALYSILRPGMSVDITAHSQSYYFKDDSQTMRWMNFNVIDSIRLKTAQHELALDDGCGHRTCPFAKFHNVV